MATRLDMPVTAARRAILERKMAERCLCFVLRKAARAVTQAYDEAFRPLGLRATQLTILFVLEGAPPLPLGRLADLVVMDRTSLTRLLAELGRRGLVKIAPEADRRRRVARLTAKGRAAVRAALPIWDAMQRRMTNLLGAGPLGELLAELSRTATKVREAS